MRKNEDPKREAILASAFTQFSRYGFRRTSMEDIARETGTSRASLYSYFANNSILQIIITLKCLMECFYTLMIRFHYFVINRWKTKVIFIKCLGF